MHLALTLCRGLAAKRSWTRRSRAPPVGTSKKVRGQVGGSVPLFSSWCVYAQDLWFLVWDQGVWTI